ncbi:MAG: hypothetical protein Ta2F_14340 [Termitinemataceae bacterium]|nr:MAG: hypothetical protein Ta2F_14340 [Termitinemataceae bacterium]
MGMGKLRCMAPVLILCFAVNLNALDTKSYDFIDLLLSIKKAGAPVVFDDAVVFTSVSNYRRVGVAFAHENFSVIYPFQKLMVPINETATFDEKSRIPPEMLRDSGILFFAYETPRDITKLEYRLVLDGLWTCDPLNPKRRLDTETGLQLSIAPVPKTAKTNPTIAKGSHSLDFTYKAESGETITVAGDFNGWDPFMYELHETQRGIYSLNLPLPAGTWKYIFYHNGNRVLDPNNNDKVYTYDGTVANVVRVND